MRWLGLLAVLGSLGCGRGAAAGPGPTDNASASTKSEPLGTSTLRGRLLDLQGRPVVGVLVTASDEFCVPGRTDGDGRFLVEGLRDGPVRLVTYGETGGGERYASVVVAVEILGDTQLGAPVRVPKLTERHPIDPSADTEQVVRASDGFELTIAPGSLSLAPFFAPEILIAAVPLDRAPTIVPAGVEIVDLHVLHPIGSTLEPPAPVRVPGVGLADGTRITFHALDYQTGLLAPVASGSVDPGGVARTSPGQGIPELTWIAISVD